MGKLGEEVSQKIKSAIKAKLMELGIHIDNELPDYVMKLEQVTISTKAKKKEKLRKRGIDDSNGISSTKKVKTERSEEIVKAEPNDYPPEPEPSPKNASIPADEDSENDDAMSLTDHTEVRNEVANEPESTSHDVCSQNDDDKNDKLSSIEAKPRERIKIVWDKDGEVAGDQSSRYRSKDNAKKVTERVREREKERRTRSRSRSRSRYTTKKKMRSDEDDERDRSRIKNKEPVRTKRTSSSPKRKTSGEGKVVDARDILKRKGADKKITSSKSRRRDSRSPHRRGARSKSREPIREKQMNSVLKAVIRAPEKPPPTIQSLVKVTPRPVRPPSMQPNCNLILKAVADAEKSLATSKVSSKKKEAYEDKKTKKGRNKRYDYANKGNISVTLLNDRVVASKLGVPLDAYPKEDAEVGEGEATKFENEASQEANTEEDTMSMAIEEDDYIDSFEREDQYTMDPPPAPPEEYQPMMHNNETPDKKRRFIISLDSTASDNEVENELESSKPNYEVSDDVSSTTVEPIVESIIPKKRKKAPEGLPEVTRCKYWPSCDAGASCLYVHPSSLCRTFPNCPFGDKCLYIHPACKFADKCLNVKCPYAHTSKTPVAKAPRPYLPISNPQLCIYYPNCTKSFCPYVHLKKPCRFGSSCMKLGCEFDHGNNSRNPYKWVATNMI
ncbi:hypothetical protein GE061_012105 [Apolygus lucorum]|uniref:Zinc finger CCCH domain-containing protein 14 n=1 Tax=Apolygus lucorum TaxID=248454 RepID=A0A8S9XRA3_APOLU|nr:hypothetical protein GE061_012105 [Apolygus lucorum]